MLACLLAIALPLMPDFTDGQNTEKEAGLDDGATIELFNAINTRLGYMQSVALYKVSNNLPVEDLPREQEVLKEAVDSAAKLGLDPNSVGTFFQVQMQLAKAIQFRYQTEIANRQNLPDAPDLMTDIRPKLDQLGMDINTLLLRRLQTDGPIMETDWNAFQHSINDPYLLEQEKQQLFDSLLSVRTH